MVMFSGTEYPLRIITDMLPVLLLLPSIGRLSASYGFKAPGRRVNPLIPRYVGCYPCTLRHSVMSCSHGVWPRSELGVKPRAPDDFDHPRRADPRRGHGRPGRHRLCRRRIVWLGRAVWLGRFARIPVGKPHVGGSIAHAHTHRFRAAARRED